MNGNDENVILSLKEVICELFLGGREEEMELHYTLNFSIEFIYFYNLVSDTVIAADLSTLMTKVLQ